MSLVAKVEQLYAEAGDGLLNAVRHVAGEVEKLVARGAPQLDVAKIVSDLESDFDAKVGEFLAAQEATVEGKLAQLEADVTAALAKLHPQPVGITGSTSVDVSGSVTGSTGSTAAPQPDPQPTGAQQNTAGAQPQGGNPT